VTPLEAFARIDAPEVMDRRHLSGEPPTLADEALTL
jgi:hypothetical protein